VVPRVVVEHDSSKVTYHFEDETTDGYDAKRPCFSFVPKPKLEYDQECEYGEEESISG